MPKNEKKKNKNHEEARKTYNGKLEVARSGMGFVIVQGLEKDIIVKPDRMNTALSGDEVKVELRGFGNGNKRMEGSIIEVVRRKQSEFSGRVEVHAHFAFLVPDSEKICTGRDLAETLGNIALTTGEAKAWRRDLKAARKTLKAPADKWA